MENLLDSQATSEENEVLVGDSYNLFVPIEDDLIKSVTVDGNGDYIVQGVMTSDDKDEEDDSISPEGMDCSYFLEKGWIKYEHGNKPEQFIGEPMEVKVGQFEHPTTGKKVNGIFVKGRLFANRELAKQAVKTITDLQKSNTKRRMGWSIEGNVVQRDRRTGKIIKSVLRNVVLTMNPINTTTWAELAKSFAKNHELTINMDEPVDKAMDLQATEAVRRQSIDGYDPEKDPQQEWIDYFRSFVRKLLKKNFRKSFIASPEYAETKAYAFAVANGLNDEGAEEFASFIVDKYEILKSLGENLGGAHMSEQVQNTLASLLDEDLEELQKALEMDDELNEEEFEDEELEKAMNEEVDENDEEEAEDEGDEEEAEGDSEEDEDDEEEEVEKSFGRTDFAKSFGANEDVSQALEVSDFLANLVDEIGFYMDGFEKSMQASRKQTTTLVKAMSSMGELLKSMASELEEVKAHNEDLQKSLTEVLNRPVGRKSLVTNREVQTLAKSMEAGRPLTRAEVSDVLIKSFEAGELNGSEISRFEAGVPLHQLNLPAEVKQKLGLA